MNEEYQIRRRDARSRMTSVFDEETFGLSAYQGVSKFKARFETPSVVVMELDT